MAEHGEMEINIEKILTRMAPKAMRRIPRFAIRYVEHTIHQEELNEGLRLYKDLDGVEFMQALVKHFDLNLELVHPERIPTEGRFIFASNHPLGGLDGICLSAVIGERFGGRIKYPVNELLLNIPNLQSIFIPIVMYKSQNRSNAGLLEEAFGSDNQIITFPAGYCSRVIDGRIQDIPWKKSFIQKAVEHQRDIVPIFFEAQNSRFFYNIARIRKALGIKMNYEIIYLPDEMFRCKHKTFRIHFGEPIPWQTFDNSKKPSEWAAWVREKVYNMNK